MKNQLTRTDPVTLQFRNAIYGTEIDYLECAHEHFKNIISSKKFKHTNAFEEQRVKNIVEDIFDEFIDFVFTYANLKKQDLTKIGRFFDIDEPSSVNLDGPDSDAFQKHYRKSLCAIVFAQLTRKGKECILENIQDDFDDILYFHIYDMELNNESFKKQMKTIYPDACTSEIRKPRDLASVLFRVMIQKMVE